MLQSTTPDLPSNPERGSGSGECSGGIMAMRAQRRTVIDPMYVEDADVLFLGAEKKIYVNTILT